MAIEASHQIAEEDVTITGYRFRDISIKTALTIPTNDEEAVETMFSMRRVTDSALSSSFIWREFKVSSYNDSTESWTQHCSGMISVETYTETGPVDAGREAAAESQFSAIRLAEASELCTNPVDTISMYTEQDAIGLAYGPLFRNFDNITSGNGTGDAMGTVKTPNVKVAMPKEFLQPHVIHPATLDSMLHVFLTSVNDLKRVKKTTEPLVPVFIKDAWISSSIGNEPGHSFHTH